MCSPAFPDSTSSALRLPEDTTDTFSLFHAWTYEGATGLPVIHTSRAEKLDLAIFADKYRVHQLYNEIVDEFKLLFTKNKYLPGADTLRKIFENTTTGCSLRGLFVSGFVLRYPSHIPFEDKPTWSRLFEEHGEMGFLCWELRDANQSFSDMPACHWHDHSNFASGVLQALHKNL